MCLNDDNIEHLANWNIIDHLDNTIISLFSWINVSSDMVKLHWFSVRTLDFFKASFYFCQMTSVDSFVYCFLCFDGTSVPSFLNSRPWHMILSGYFAQESIELNTFSSLSQCMILTDLFDQRSWNTFQGWFILLQSTNSKHKTWFHGK